MKDNKVIVAVGGGFAGIKLIKRLKNTKRYKIILVDTNNYNFFSATNISSFGRIYGAFCHQLPI